MDLLTYVLSTVIHLNCHIDVSKSNNYSTVALVVPISIVVSRVV